MNTPDEIQIRSGSVYRWLMDHYAGAEPLPEKLVRHFEVDVPGLVAEIERLKAANANLIRNAEILADELVLNAGVTT